MGIIFTPENCNKIVSGYKTATTRLMKDGETYRVFERAIVSVYTKSGRVKWRVNSSYAVMPGRGQCAVGRVVINSIALMQISDLDPLLHIAEGYSSQDAYLGALLSITGKKRLDREWVWVLRFYFTGGSS